MLFVVNLHSDSHCTLAPNFVQVGWLAGWLASRKYNYKTMSVRSVACGRLYQNMIVCNCYVSLVQCASSFISFIRNCVIDTVIKAAAGTYIQFSFRKNSVIDQKDEIKKVIDVAYKSFNINPFNLFLKGHKTMFLNLSYFLQFIHDSRKTTFIVT